jgi:hypothetical protein
MITVIVIATAIAAVKVSNEDFLLNYHEKV